MRVEGRRQNEKIRNLILHPSSLILIFITAVLLSSCATVNHTPKASHTRLIENVPFHPQLTYQCGPASLAGVLNYWGVNVTPDDIAKEIYSESAKGTLDMDMILYAQRKGVKTIQYKGSMEDIKKNIESGFPIIVLVDYGFSFYQQNHFMVVVGYNEGGVVVNSGKDKNMFISEKDFIKAWKKTNYWTLLLKPNE